MTLQIKNKNLDSAIVIFSHLFIFIILYLILSFFGFIKGLPNNTSLMQWDAWWYKSIIDNGYSFNPDGQSNIAFFPLFPFIWKFFQLTPVLISVLNLFFLFSGMIVLRNAYHFNRMEFLLLLSIPSLFFCYVPYSEAVFFLAGSFIIYGLKKDFKIALLGVFLAGLARSATLIFIPIILFSKIYNYRPGKNNKKLIIETTYLILTSIISTLFAQLIQFQGSGKFFTIFEVQKEWNRILSIPVLYFTTWDGARLIWLDGLALFTGILSISLIVLFLWKKLSKHNKTFSSAFLFSIGYLALVSITTLLYSSEDAIGGTSIYSLNRFVFATPFFTVFIIMGLRIIQINKKSVLYFVVIALLTWLLFNAHGYLPGADRTLVQFLKAKVYFGIVFLYSFVYLLLADNRIKITLWSGLYLLNMILQIFLFNEFINGKWIG